MKPFVTETETAIVVVIPKHLALPGVIKPADIEGHGTYCIEGQVFQFSSNVLKAAAMWKAGRTAAEISDALKLSPRKRNIDAGQAFLHCIRVVMPDLLPPRNPPNRRHPDNGK